MLAVVGLSAAVAPAELTSPPSTCSSHGYRVIPVNPQYAAKCLGQKLLLPAARHPGEGRPGGRVPQDRRTVLPVAEDAIAIGARVFWQQLGAATRRPCRPGPRRTG